MDERTMQLALQLADDAARGTLLMESRPSEDGEGWLDLSAIPTEAQTTVAEALEYLELRGLLFYKEGTADLVRFSEPGLLH